MCIYIIQSWTMTQQPMTKEIKKSAKIDICQTSFEVAPIRGKMGDKAFVTQKCQGPEVEK